MVIFSKLRFRRLLMALLGFVLATSVLLIEQPLEASTSPAATDLSLTQDVRKTVLENGLTVLTKEVHTAPVVSVQIWYRVGSRNEAPGENGISHQLEHLMFKGTRDRPIQFGRLFNALGSESNAFTSYDQTAYFGTVQRDKLEALLILEADRMQNALISDEQLASEKRVVISELQGYENNPEYRLGRTVMRQVFPDHPYGLPVGGTRADVERFTVEQVVDYYKTYYNPANATLVVVGDFETEPLLNTIREGYGAIARPASGAEVAQSASVPSPQSAIASGTPTPIVLREPGSSAFLNVVYPLPNALHPDVPAIDLMDMILTAGRSSRLYQSLVESGLASSVSAYPVELIEPGWYDISITAAPGQTLEAIENQLQQSFSELQQNGVTDAELTRAKTQLKAYFVLSNQDISSQASQLGYNQTQTGDYQFSDRYLEALDRVTMADIQRVANQYLDPAKRTVGFFEPTQPDGQAGASPGGGVGQTVENFSPGAPVDPAEVARYLPPLPSETVSSTQSIPDQFTLSNGVRVLLLPDSSTPTVNLSGWVEAGSSFDPDSKAGLANLTADNLMNGTTTRDALTLAQILEDEGTELNFAANREGVSIESSALSSSLPTVVQVLADVLQQATFPADQLELSRQRALTELSVQLDDPRYLGRRVFQQALYPAGHPFHAFPTEESLKAVTQADLVSFYQQHYRPDTTTLALVGDFDPAAVRSLLEENFGGWQAQGQRPTLQLSNISLPRSLTRLNPVIPGKSESVTYLGYGGISRKDPRFYPTLVLNQILGGDTLSSRLGTEIRDRQGLTYGIYSYFQAGVYPGPFLITLQTDPDDASRAIDSTLALLRQLRDQGVTQAEVDTAKRSIMNSYPVELSNPTELSSVILSNAIYGLDPEEIREFPQAIESVSLAQVRRAIREFIHPGNLVIVTAGPGDTE